MKRNGRNSFRQVDQHVKKQKETQKISKTGGSSQWLSPKRERKHSEVRSQGATINHQAIIHMPGP